MADKPVETDLTAPELVNITAGLSLIPIKDILLQARVVSCCRSHPVRQRLVRLGDPG